MSIAQEAARGYDPYIIAAGPRSKAGLPKFEHAERTLASKRVISAFGFWIFLLSDIIMFSALFATYAVLVPATAGGPTGRQLFDYRNVAIDPDVWSAKVLEEILCARCNKHRNCSLRNE